MGIGIQRGQTMHRKLHLDTLTLIPKFKIYVFSYSRWSDRQRDREIHSLHVG
jgi:hypothetical protein